MFDEDVLPTARTAEESKQNRPLQTRRCHGSNAELKGERGTGDIVLALLSQALNTGEQSMPNKNCCFINDAENG